MIITIDDHRFNYDGNPELLRNIKPFIVKEFKSERITAQLGIPQNLHVFVLRSDKAMTVLQIGVAERKINALLSNIDVTKSLGKEIKRLQIRIKIEAGLHPKNPQLQEEGQTAHLIFYTGSGVDTKDFLYTITRILEVLTGQKLPQIRSGSNLHYELKRLIPNRLNRRKEDKAMNATGGIDLNPAQMSMQVKKQGEDFKFDFNGVQIDAAQVTGATFTISQMTPVTNLAHVLGLAPV